jgi:uncharacterized protein DUF4326
MTSPKRVKVGGDRFHPIVPEHSVYVGRQAPYLKRSPFANPFTVKEYGRERALELFRQGLVADPEMVSRIRTYLGGWDLACWCGLDQDCHGGILLRVAAGDEP